MFDAIKWPRDLHLLQERKFKLKFCAMLEQKKRTIARVLKTPRVELPSEHNPAEVPTAMRGCNSDVAKACTYNSISYDHALAVDAYRCATEDVERFPAKRSGKSRCERY